MHCIGVHSDHAICTCTAKASRGPKILRAISTSPCSKNMLTKSKRGTFAKPISKLRAGSWQVGSAVVLRNAL